MRETCYLCQERIHRDLRWHHIFSLEAASQDPLCEDCRLKFRPYQASDLACDHCGRPLKAEADRFHQEQHYEGHSYCLDCLYWAKRYPPTYLHHQTLLTYDAWVRQWFYAYKYQGDRRLALLMKDYLQGVYPTYKSHQWWVLPSSPLALDKRGFHPMGAVLDEAGIPYNCPFIYQGDNQRQASKNRQDRMKLGQVFAWKEEEVIDWNRSILLFDDVYTTGSTLMRAKDLILSSCPQAKVHSLTLAREL